jgi:hypothetical protein
MNMNSYDSNPSTLTHPAFANEQLRGKRNRRAERGEEKGRDPQRRDGRSSGYLQVSARLRQGNMGPRPACKRKPAWGGNVQMQKATGTPAPRTPPPLSPTAGPARTHRLLPGSPPTCNDFILAITCPHRNLSRPQKFHRAHLGAAVLLHIFAIRHEDVMT